MTNLEMWALLAFMVGVLIKRFLSPQVGDTIEVIAAILFILAWIFSFHA